MVFGREKELMKLYRKVVPAMLRDTTGSIDVSPMGTRVTLINNFLFIKYSSHHLFYTSDPLGNKAESKTEYTELNWSKCW